MGHPELLIVSLPLLEEVIQMVIFNLILFDFFNFKCGKFQTLSIMRNHFKPEHFFQ